MPKGRTQLSKFLSLVLRHRPEVIGLQLDAGGWAEIAELLERCRAHGRPLTRETLQEMVDTSPKRRFAISEDGLRVRASQGHSLEVDLGYQASEPPEILFHGTVAASLAAIRAAGLLPMGRHHVHLSPDLETARAVGMRRGAPLVLLVAAGRMQRAGHLFFRAANGVWLTAEVPPGYIDFPDD